MPSVLVPLADRVGRSPHGERGLKLEDPISLFQVCHVALLMESVD